MDETTIPTTTEEVIIPTTPIEETPTEEATPVAEEVAVVAEEVATI